MYPFETYQEINVLRGVVPYGATFNTVRPALVVTMLTQYGTREALIVGAVILTLLYPAIHTFLLVEVRGLAYVVIRVSPRIKTKIHDTKYTLRVESLVKGTAYETIALRSQGLAIELDLNQLVVGRCASVCAKKTRR